jgi:hypothetical protein
MQMNIRKINKKSQKENMPYIKDSWALYIRGHALTLVIFCNKQDIIMTEIIKLYIYVLFEISDWKY